MGESFQDYFGSLDFEADFTFIESQPQNTEFGRILYLLSFIFSLKAMNQLK